MGYYTSYELDIVENDSNVSDHEIIKSFRNFSEDANYAIDENGESETDCKWYEHEKELKEYSLLHPKVLFCLSGEGEESGDIWKHYFKNGKSKYCPANITFGNGDKKEGVQSEINEYFKLEKRVISCPQCGGSEIVDNKCSYCGSTFQ